MFEKCLPAIGIAGLIVLTAGYFLIAAPREAARKDTLAFSNTQDWDPKLLAFTVTSTRYPAEIFDSIVVPPPPQNSSDAVADELETLLAYQALRMPQKRQDIIAEDTFYTMDFGGYRVSTYRDGGQFPETAVLLGDSLYDLQIVVLRQKKKFDRVRPTFLDLSLDTVIPVPGHPAYPSGHSTQLHFLAYVFGELAPERRDEFAARADEIAKNREIAGLHYPSDTRAGVLLAEQFFAIMMQNAKFQELSASAKKEWITRGLADAHSSPN